MVAAAGLAGAAAADGVGCRVITQQERQEQRDRAADQESRERGAGRRVAAEAQGGHWSCSVDRASSRPA